MRSWIVGLVVVLVAGGQLQGALIIHESATLGAVGQTGGVALFTDQFLGSRFTLDNPVQVDAVGGHIVDFLQISDGLFGTIVSLSGPNALPSGSPFDTTTLATTDFMASYPSTDFLTPLSVTLPPGDYALIFGANAGALGGMPFNNTDVPGQASYFKWNGGSWVDGGLFDTRVVVTGAVIPEPTTFIIWSLLGVLGITVGWWRRRRRAA